MHQEIKKYKKEQLADFIHSEIFQRTNVLPITFHRALSYLSNPRLDKDDYIMYLAFEANEIVAYRLVLPDLFFIDNQPYKMGWFSCIYVLPDKRSTGIAKTLSALAMEDWKGMIAYNDPVVASKNLYGSTDKFTLCEGNVGIRAYLRFNFQSLRKARGSSNKLTNSLLGMVDLVLNKINETRLLLWKRRLYKSVEGKMQYIAAIDEEVAGLVEESNKNEWMKRGVKELNWILEHPWIIETNEEKEDAYRYHFSAYSKEYKIFKIKILNDLNETKGLLIMQLRNGQLKIPYFYCDQDSMKTLLDIVYMQLLKTGASTLSVFNKDVVSCIRSYPHPFWLLREKKRPLYFANKILSMMKNSDGYFQDGDGDNVFT